AGDAYLRVGQSAPVGPLHRDALLAAINAYEEAMAAQPAPSLAAEPEATTPPEEDAPAGEEATKEPAPDGPPTDGEKPGGSPYTALEQKFILAVDLFSALFPDDEQNGAVLYKLGEFFYGRGDYG